MLKKIALVVFSAVVGAVLFAVAGLILFMNSQPDLAPWHTIVLENEFNAKSEIATLEDYLKLEDELFEELNKKIINPLPAKHRSNINRFTSGSFSDPARWPVNWNRSYELKAQDPKAAVLMLHGLSDSPYSLRQLAQDLNAAGVWVVGLRIPGHGTTPSGLTDIRWQDMAAAVRIIFSDMQRRMGERPVHIVGYSNGAALAVNYSLEALSKNTLPLPARLVLISPAIGITPFAALAVWQSRLGALFDLEKLQWSSVIPEYDPYKYQSFAINAGDLSHRFTGEIRKQLDLLQQQNKLDAFPPSLVFLSAVDATVSTRAVVIDLLRRLTPKQHKLVVFDLNRRQNMQHLFTAADPKQDLDKLLANNALPFDLSVITNIDGSDRVVVKTNSASSKGLEEKQLNLTWPKDAYSLSHVALPFPPDDPLYGGPGAKASPGITLGKTSLRGETGALAVPAQDMLRQRWNPFYSYLKKETQDFLRQ